MLGVEVACWTDPKSSSVLDERYGRIENTCLQKSRPKLCLIGYGAEPSLGGKRILSLHCGDITRKREVSHRERTEKSRRG
jgi:hypothetical protein